MTGSPQSVREIFASKYDDLDSDWGGHGSGPGSDPYYNLPYRTFLETFLIQNRISSIVDIGCGDWQFSRFIRFEGLQYLGLDLVESVIKRNNALFGAANVRFEMMPDDKGSAPGADLLVIKDVLQHLSNEEITDFYHKVIPKYKYCLITNSYRKVHTPTNVDTGSGGFRCLDLPSEPYRWRGAYVLQFTTGVWEEIRTLLVLN